ncbi:MBL fold metallo-hydrolase [Pseudonocardia sp. S2-4]|uniref:MBL fold metallo-hydrolase n=2 Tax=Pseudonocardia humida TaxID=2800819 RepID=A0ABT0ZRZ5_9PSEU|nr:MBL fold metallo-hydrolase [Pseudonocardia humida]
MLSRGRTGRPARPVPLAAAVGPGPAGELAATWFGHSSVLVEVDGHRVLADPMWGERASPSGRIGPRRLHPAPMRLADLPPVDAVVISHDHYDHLDLPTVRTLTRLTGAPFVVPLGVGAHLRRWGVPDSRVVELDWGGAVTLPGAAGGLTITCVEARHFSGRGLVRNTTQWSSWALAGSRHRVFFGGDTGFHGALAGIGDRLGPFDLTLLPIGAYSDLWPDIHMTPEEAVAAHRALRGGLLVPIHWATFDLGFHTWSEPVERVRRAAAEAGVGLGLPRPGQRLDATAPPADSDWWSSVAFASDSAAARPVADVGRATFRPASTMRRALLYYRGR